MTTLGAVFLPDLPPEQLRAVALAADDAGLDELWLWEDCFREAGIASAAAVLAWTSRVRVGIGLLPVPLRNVALTAMELATLERLFPGRLAVGLGHGVQQWMGQVGARVESPLTLLGEYATALRALLAGEQVTTSGRYVRLDQVRLDWPPVQAPPLLGGAVGPRSLRLCGEVADGTVLVAGTTPDGVRRARALIDAGRDAAARSGPHRVVVYLLAATGAGAAERLATALPEEVPGADGTRGAAGADGPVAVAGNAAEVAAAVRQWAEAGADTVVLQPTGDDPDPLGFVRFVAGEVRPLVD